MIPMTRQSGSSPVDTLHRELDRAFDRLWSGSQGWPEWTGTAMYPVDIHEDDDAIHVDAELPGFTKDEIEITMEQGVLTISAQRKEEHQPKGEQHLSERQFRRVARSFRLPSAVDENGVEAQLKEGVLHLRLPKREEVKPRKISVK